MQGTTADSRSSSSLTLSPNTKQGWSFCIENIQELSPCYMAKFLLLFQKWPPIEKIFYTISALYIAVVFHTIYVQLNHSDILSFTLLTTVFLHVTFYYYQRLIGNLICCFINKHFTVGWDPLQNNLISTSLYFFQQCPCYSNSKCIVRR